MMSFVEATMKVLRRHKIKVRSTRKRPPKEDEDYEEVALTDNEDATFVDEGGPTRATLPSRWNRQRARQARYPDHGHLSWNL